jgi:mono/diheme cytochrome c family protein
MLVNGSPVSRANVAKLVSDGYNGGASGNMPGAQANALSEKDVADVTAYLASLK